MRDLLKQYFGYDDFLPLQEEIISSVLDARDGLVLMPTGGGKSLCYQLPALRLDGLTLVVSPLIALMKDQVDALKSNGIAAGVLNSTLTFAEVRRVQEQVQQGVLKILYVAPERLSQQAFQSFLARSGSALWLSTKRTASPCGGTTSAPITAGWANYVAACPGCHFWR